MNQNELPCRLYKCFNKVEYALALADRGCAPIRTLSWCRNIENGAPPSQLNRADALEGMSGTKIDYLASPPGGFPDGPDLPKWSEREIQRICRLGSATLIQNCRIMKTVRDMYLYCTSQHLTQPLLDKYGSYVVEILRPLPFFTSLGSELARKGRDWGKCVVGFSNL